MKKIPVIAAMLSLFGHAALATTPDIGEITGSIGIKNTTNEDVTVTCTIGSQQYPLGSPNTVTIHGNGDYHLFSGSAGDGCSPSLFDNGNNKIVCSYKDSLTNNTGTFTVLACQNTIYPTHDQPTTTYSNNLQISGIAPPTPYKCTYSSASYYTRAEGSGDNPCPSNSSNPQSAMAFYCTAEAYFAVGSEVPVGPTYTLTWKNIKMNLTKGQAVGDKLTSILKNSGTYGTPTSSYDGSTLKITLPPPTYPNPNPYEDCTDLGKCKTAFSA